MEKAENPVRILVYGMTDNRGGIEAYLINMLRAMNREKIIFDFIVDWDTMAYADEAQGLGSKIYFIPAKGKSPVGHLTAFFKILKAHPEYKTVYFNILNAGGAYSMLAPKALKRRIAVHSHNGSADNMKLHKMFFGMLNRFADVKLACSALAAEYMFDNPKEVTVINNAVQTDDFTFNAELREQKRQELKLGESFTVLHAGRMTNQKNPMFLLEIFSQLVKIKPDSILLYAGAGVDSMEQEIRQKAEELGIAGKIRFLGMRNDVNELMQAADVFLLPSKYEGLPITGVEAQAADLPCFFSDRISPAVAITSKACLLSIDLSAEEWARQIAAIQPEKRVPRVAELEAAGYSLEAQAQKLTEMLI